jgi:hypothetical protein
MPRFLVDLNKAKDSCSGDVQEQDVDLSSLYSPSFPFFAHNYTVGQLNFFFTLFLLFFFVVFFSFEKKTFTTTRFRAENVFDSRNVENSL